ncbi:MAG: glutamine amidotransferase [Tepidisphaerales bacterium]
MSGTQVLYMGDTALLGAAAYLAGLMTAWGVSFEYVPSDRKLEASQVQAARRLFILSDYPAAMLADALAEIIVQQVRDGAGLLMIGGWESYCGKGGDWAGTKIADALPVEIGRRDDRVNCDQSALAVKAVDHPITRGLPWDDCPPTIGGYNRIAPRAGTQTLLEVQRFAARRIGERFTFTPAGRDPLLVVGEHGQGRTAALATDVAPHWVGGMVDWGTGRVQAAAAPGAGIEVGDQYAAFFRQLLSWTGRLDGAIASVPRTG